MAKRVITQQAKDLHQALVNKGIAADLEFWDGHKHLDICIPAAKLYIEVDGMHHFTNPDQMARDFIRDHYSDDEGFSTLRIPNQVVVDQLEEVVAAIENVVTERMCGTEI